MDENEIMEPCRLEHLLRPELIGVSRPETARGHLTAGRPYLLLDANENPYNAPMNRMYDRSRAALAERIAEVKSVSCGQVFVTNGAEVLADLVYRCFCRPSLDNVVAISPTRDLYARCARLNGVAYRPVLLDRDFQVTAGRILDACDLHTKVIWLCSPNDPSGSILRREEVSRVLRAFPGIVVLDETYGDFAPAHTFRKRLLQYPNLVVMDDMSHAWGRGALQVAVAYGSKAVVDAFALFSEMVQPSIQSVRLALEAYADPFEMEKWARTIMLECHQVMTAFAMLPCCRKVYPTSANFFLARMDDADAVYAYLLSKGILVHKCADGVCEDCLRITIGTKTENNLLLSALRQYGR